MNVVSFFSPFSLVAILYSGAVPFQQFCVAAIVGNIYANYFEFLCQRFKKRCRLKIFTFSSGGQFCSAEPNCLV